MEEKEKEKVSLIDAYEELFSGMLEMSNIPVFMSLREESDLVEKFFTKHDVFYKMYGDRVCSLLDEIMISTIVDEACDQVYDALNMPNLVYPGNWYYGNIFRLASNCISMVHDMSSGEERLALVVKSPDVDWAKDKDDEDAKNKMAVMYFSDYNADDFCKMAMETFVKVIFSEIIKYISDNVPVQFSSSADIPAPARFVYELAGLFKDHDCVDKLAKKMVNFPHPNKSVVEEVLAEVDPIFFAYFNGLSMVQCGFNREVVGAVIKEINNRMLYELDNNTPFYKVAITANARSSIYPELPGATANFTIGDLFTIVKAAFREINGPEDYFTNLERREQDDIMRVGCKMKGFMLSMCRLYESIVVKRLDVQDDEKKTDSVPNENV